LHLGQKNRHFIKTTGEPEIAHRVDGNQLCMGGLGDFPGEGQSTPRFGRVIYADDYRFRRHVPPPLDTAIATATSFQFNGRADPMKAA
jgi:hypothetical protein